MVVVVVVVVRTNHVGIMAAVKRNNVYTVLDSKIASSVYYYCYSSGEGPITNLSAHYQSSTKRLILCAQPLYALLPLNSGVQSTAVVL